MGDLRSNVSARSGDLRCYLVARFWPVFTWQFPVDKFNRLGDDKLWPALMKFAVDWLRQNESQSGLSINAPGMLVSSARRIDPVQHPLRAPCRCGGQGTIETKNGQDVVRCRRCKKYCAPRKETGRAVRTVSTVHGAIKPGQRARVLLRAGDRCELCGKQELLHVGHIISVKSGLALGMTDAEVNDDENLCALCEECDLGISDEPIPLRLAIGMVLSRIDFTRKEVESCSR